MVDDGFLKIGLKDICVELLQEILSDLGDIGCIYGPSKYNINGVIEDRAS
jgi:hypothetical protein